MKSANKLIFKLRKIFSRTKVNLLCIGMENTAAWGQCIGSKVDAEKFFKLAKPRCSRTKLLLDNQATKANVIAEMAETCKADLAIIYYSGHGGQQKAKDGRKTEPDGLDEFLAVYDKALVDNEIWQIISNAKGRVFMVFDCCHSETMFRGISFENFQERGNSTVDLICWSGCADDKYSYGDESGGMLTSAIKKHLSVFDTYDSLWKKIAKDRNLKQYEIAKQTILGNGSKFKKKKIFS